MLYRLQGPGHHTCTRSLESRVPAKFNLITSLTFGMLLGENKKFRLLTPKNRCHISLLKSLSEF